jgi:hypothetical protein
MEYDPVLKVIALLQDNAYPIFGRIEILSFLGNLAAYDSRYRESMIRDGAGSLFIQMGHEIIKTKEPDQLLLYKYLGSSQGFMRIFYKKKANKSPNLNLVNTFLPILASIITN